MRKKQICLIMLTVIFILTFGTQSAYAYFTANDTALGGLILSSITTEIEEQVINHEKIVDIINYKYGTPVFVRARGFCGDDQNLTYFNRQADEDDRKEEEGFLIEGSWYDGGDGWWYYNAPLETNVIPENTSDNAYSFSHLLVVKIDDKKFPKDVEPDESFNVVVVYEATRALYAADGSAYADWSNTLNSQEGGE